VTGIGSVRERAGAIGAPGSRAGPDIASEQAEFHLPDIARATGTTRMWVDPRSGVVESDCAGHGVDGLYIAGSSVFPTSGHANPTQMIVAIAIRPADRLNAELARRPAVADRHLAR